MIRATGILLAAWLCTSLCSAQTGQRDLTVAGPARRALVIGNDAYQHVSPLRNAVNDARDLTAKLETLGFETVVATDVDLRAMEQAIDGFISSIRPGDVALFHFSGHGVQADQENYLIPTSFELRDRASLRYDAYSASKLQDRLDEAGAQLSLVFLDACRNNGFGGSRSAGGLAPMNPAHGSFIAFATGPGKTADDNPSGRNGLFTGVLLETLEQPGLELTDVFRQVREQVSAKSEGRQVPWTISSVLGRFYFDESAAATAPLPVDDASIELAYWQSIQQDDSREGYESYLRRYPDGTFAELARLKLERLDGEPAPSAAEVRVNPADGADYVWISAGSFTQGCVEGDSACKDDELPRREVEITRGFWLAKTETTVARYKAYADRNKLQMPPFPGYIAPLLPLLPPVAPGFNLGWKLEDHPITNVSWNEAKAYCEAAGGRLPTEAEWEYAARGGRDGEPYPWGSNISRDQANFGADNGGSGAAEGADKWVNTAPAASFPANGFGLHDMAGNLWEWTADAYASDAYKGGPAQDPTGPASGTDRVLRGGAWDNPARALRSSDRNHFHPAAVNPWIGIRCAVNSLPE